VEWRQDVKLHYIPENPPCPGRRDSEPEFKDLLQRHIHLQRLAGTDAVRNSLRGCGAATDVAISSIALLAEHHVPAVVVPKRVAARRLKNLPSRVIDVYNHRFRLHGNLVLTGEGNA
jgi:hypothetical protein